MGWLFTHRPAGISDRDWFQKECVGDSYEIIECATVRMVFYAAVRDKKTDEVWALVCLTQRRPNREDFNYGWKSMEESMGPCEDHAPAKVLDLLSPTDSEWALQWRERCRANLARAEKARQVKPGMRIKLKHPLSFTDGVERDTFVYKGRNQMVATDGVRCRVTNWRLREFEVLAS